MRVNEFMPHQITINHDGIMWLLSYQSIVARIDKDETITLSNHWDYSKTTLRALKLFLVYHPLFEGRERTIGCFKERVLSLVKQGKIKMFNGDSICD